MDKRSLRRNRLAFGLGTVGRDAAAAMVSLYLMYYASDVLEVSAATLGMITTVIVFMRIFDGVNDPFMGTLVDNTRSRYGKFKPWILIGAVLWSVFNVLMFLDTGLRGVPYVIAFTVFYLGWEISYTANDIAYWSMIPALSRSQEEREKIGSVARVCASIGMFALVVAIIPVTNWLGERLGSLQRGWFTLAVVLSVLLLAFQLITVVFAKEERIPIAKEEKTGFLELFSVIFKNDQLLVVTVGMLFFMAGYTLTTSLGIYYFKYVYGDENMYAIFALVLGVSQIAGLVFFPLLAERFKRQSLFTAGIGLVLLGYIGFFFSPLNMLAIGFSGILIFVGQAFIQLLMLLYIADCVEYGQWKLGKRNESVTFSLQPLIYKVSNALANALLGVSLFAARVQSAQSAADMTSRDVVVLKVFMMVIPSVMIIVCFIVISAFYRIDERFYGEILSTNLEHEKELADAD